MESDLFTELTAFQKGIDSQLPITAKNTKAYATAFEQVIGSFAPELKENYQRFQKLAFYRKYVEGPDDSLVLAYNRILAKMMQEKAADYANFQINNKDGK